MLFKLEDDKINKKQKAGAGDEIQIVYLILAHSNAELLGRMINALDNEKVHFFIHIDKKADLNNFQRYLPEKQNIHLTKNRIKVFWGGYSIVQSTLNLMGEAIKSNIDFKYAVLLSGAHYPIKSNDYILKYFQTSDCEYLQFAKVCEVSCEFKINPFCLYDYAFFNPRTVFFENKILNRIARIPGMTVNLTFRKMITIFYKRKLVRNIIPYTGANWWALTQACVKYVLDYTNNNRDYVECFRFSMAPDETFFHSIICNSTFKLANDDITLMSLTGKYKELRKYSKLKGLCLTFMKCSPTGNPKTLSEAEFVEISKESNFFGSHCLFARKFDPETSFGLLNIIDKEILRLNSDEKER